MRTLRIASAAYVGIGTEIVITGYADKSGNPAANVELAKKRAQSVRDELVALGVDARRIVLQAPVSVTGPGSDNEARRVDVLVAGTADLAERGVEDVVVELGELVVGGLVSHGVGGSFVVVGFQLVPKQGSERRRLAVDGARAGERLAASADEPRRRGLGGARLRVVAEADVDLHAIASASGSIPSSARATLPDPGKMSTTSSTAGS